MKQDGKLITVVAMYAALTLIAKELSLSMEVFAQSFMRGLLAAIAGTLVFKTYRHIARVPRRDWLLAALRGFLLSLFGAGFWILAMSYSKLGIVSFLTCLPYEAVFGMLLFKERINFLQGAGLIVSLCGVALLTNAFSPGIDHNATIGALFAAASGCGWALGVALTRFHSKDLAPTHLNTLTIWSCCIWQLLGFLALQESRLFPVTIWEWELTVLGALTVVIANELFNHLARTVSMVRIAIFNLLQPAMVAVAAAVILSEQLSGQEITGGILIVRGAAAYTLQQRT